ncbi:MAG: outer membrane protein assembly factor [Halioglobus sp.]|nr:outer membrane protein assembly factor [Halioglobus sp.]
MIRPDRPSTALVARHGPRRAALRGWLAPVIALLSLGASSARADDVAVRIDGLQEPLLTNVRKSLSVAAEHEKPWSAARIQRLYRLGAREIRQALQPYGYYNPTSEAALEPPAAGESTWRVSFTVDAGPPTRVTGLHLAVNGPGRAAPAVRSALEQTRLAQGKRLVHADYSDTKRALYNAAYGAGYLDAHFSQSVMRVDPKTDSAQIELVLDTGERFYFGPVTFHQSVLNDAFVQRFVPFAPGDPFDAEQLIALQLALSSTDYFGQIAIDADHNSARRVPPDDATSSAASQGVETVDEPAARLEIPVNVTAEPSKPQHYRLSAGYGTDTGPRVGVGVKFRHLNRHGHQFSTDLRISQVQQALSASYDIPIGNVASDRLSFTADIANEEFGDIGTLRYGLGAMRDTAWESGRNRIYLNLWRDSYNLGDDRRTSTLFYPGYTFSLQRADDLLFTHQGISLELDARGGSAALLSSTDFLRGTAVLRTVLPLGANSRLLMRAEAGAIAASDFADVSPAQRFFAGGAQSIRGYSYQSISPRNAKGDNVGGKFLGVGSVEADYFFYKNYGIAAFYDVGDSVDSLNDFSLQKGVGIGFRWASPVGMVRLDFAHPLDDPDTALQIHFSLGPDL